MAHLTGMSVGFGVKMATHWHSYIRVCLEAAKLLYRALLHKCIGVNDRVASYFDVLQPAMRVNVHCMRL